MSRLLLVLATLATLLGAGCVTPADTVERQAVAPSVALPHLDLDAAHDHKDRAQHDVAWNAERLGWHPVAPDPAKPGRYNHVSLFGDLAFVSVYALAADAPPGLAVFDVSADAPQLLGTLETPGFTPIDVWPSPDGRFVFLAGHRDDRAKAPALPGEPCVGTPAITLCRPFLPAGVLMVDVQDPAAPKLAARHTSAPSGAHTVKSFEVDGELYVFVASYGFSYADRLASGVEILKVHEEGPRGAWLEPVSRFFAKRLSGPSGAERTFVHDMWIETHPDGRHLMYVAYWDGGVVIADVSDPAKPEEVSDWRDFDANQYGNIHFARPVGVIDGRHVTMAAPEFGSADHSGEMYVLDTTDPAKPVLLSKWVLPGDPVNDEGYRFSPHNFAPRGAQVAYAHYHGGVWILDLAVPAAPVVKAYFFPVVPEGAALPDEVKEDAPLVWAADWTPRGTLLASDMGTGLHHWRLTGADTGVPPYER